jgi:hypothetical protein
MPAGKTYEPIATKSVPTDGTTSVTFSSIPGTYTDLILIVTGIGATGGTFPWMQFNGISTNTYSDTQLYASAGAAGSARRSAQSRGYIAEQVEMGATQLSNTIVHIMNYSNSTTFKTYLARNNNASAGTYVGTEAIVGLWQGTDAITSIKIGTASSGINFDFASGSTFALYGIKAA